MSKEKWRKLMERWEGQEQRIKKIIESARRREDWTVHLEGLPFVEEIEVNKPERSGGDLRGIDLRGLNLSGVRLVGATMNEAMLNGAKLKGADLSGACLDEAIFNEADLRQTQLGMTSLIDAALIETDLRGANLMWSKLLRAKLIRTDLRGAWLTRADLTEAEVRDSDLRNAKLLSTNFNNTFVHNLRFNSAMSCRGIRVATCYGSPRFKRFAQDQDYLEELRESRIGKWIYWPWLILANCGRSIWQWAIWSTILMLSFAFVYFFHLGECFKVLHLQEWSFRTALYYSVVTFTTLGFGDVVPTDYPAPYWIMAEVIIGYIMLGGLISIFATKFARRA